MQLGKPSILPTIFFIFFAVSTVAEMKYCEYRYYYFFDNPIIIYRYMAESGDFVVDDIRENSNVICKKLELNGISGLEHQIYLMNSKNHNIITSKNQGYLHILDSNVPELNTKTFSPVKDYFKGIRIVNSNVSRIDPTFLTGFHNLEKIVLNNNNIDSNQTNHFFECKTLKIVSLSYNKLTSLGNLLNISNLQCLILNNNFITSLDGISSLKQIKQLDVSHNNISDIPTEFQNIHPIVVDLSYNNITKFENCSNIIQIVILNNNELKQFCTFSNTIKKIDYSDNIITDIDEIVFKGLTRLEELNLSNNHIQEIASNVFEDLEQLMHLNLSNNFIHTLHLGCFINLRELTTLDLKDNYLHELEADVFTNLTYLKYLDLSENNIYDFDVTTIFPLRLLNDLYLEDIKIDENLVAKFTEYFPYLTSISLSFTNIGCDKLIGIIKHLKSSSINVKQGKKARWGENINGIICDPSIKNATETVEEIQLYNMLKSMSRIYAILIVVCVMIIAIILSTIIKKSYDLSKKYKNISNDQIL